ncbi:maltotransferase domain-containing protein, partial [Streptomyces sp. WAC00469]|uniref:maltotransferase domain-containing protein n=1 Tax=Streptomyces sp. WAC00469 TaxID=2487415 RepID=UPI000F73FF43
MSRQDPGPRPGHGTRPGVCPAPATVEVTSVGATPSPVPVVGRIPVRDVRPAVAGGRHPAKAVTGESFQVTATVFGEGHAAVAANVVLTDPEGRPGPWTPM